MKTVLLIFLLLLPSAVADGQDCDHTSNSAGRFSNVRLLPAVTIRAVHAGEVSYEHPEVTGRVTTDRETVMATDPLVSDKKKLYWILYCLRCRHAYMIVDVLPERLRKEESPKSRTASRYF